jgi:hypothetical protein
LFNARSQNFEPNQEMQNAFAVAGALMPDAHVG